MADSSLAYQGYGRGINKDNIRLVNKWAMQDIEPDIIFYLKMNAKDAMQRIQKRTILTTFEKENSAFIEQLIIGFDTIFADRSNVITIDGMLSIDDVTLCAYKVVNSWQQQSMHQ